MVARLVGLLLALMVLAYQDLQQAAAPLPAASLTKEMVTLKTGAPLYGEQRFMAILDKR